MPLSGGATMCVVLSYAPEASSCVQRQWLRRAQKEEGVSVYSAVGAPMLAATQGKAQRHAAACCGAYRLALRRKAGRTRQFSSRAAEGRPYARAPCASLSPGRGPTAGAGPKRPGRGPANRAGGCRKGLRSETCPCSMRPHLGAWQGRGQGADGGWARDVLGRKRVARVPANKARERGQACVARRATHPHAGWARRNTLVVFRWVVHGRADQQEGNVPSQAHP